MYDYPMMNDYGSYGWAWGVGMMVFWGALLVLVALVVLRLLRHHEGTHVSRTTPLDIAKERYAKGDITKEQFEELKKSLKD